MTGTGPTMPLLRHLEELRRRLLWSVAAVLLLSVAGYYVSGWMVDFLTRAVPRLVFITPSEAFVTRLKVAVVAGALAAAPFVFYQFWRFVQPGLTAREARYVLPAVAACTVFFAGGVAFAYRVVLPFGLKFLLQFETPKLQAMLSVERFVEFVGVFLLAFGLVFQMPVVIFFLAKLGLVTPKGLRKARRWAIVAIFVVAGVLTPPDVISQLLMAAPLLVLYELSILGAMLARRTGPAAGR